MNDFSLIFIVAAAAALVVLPGKWAPLPLLIGTCYMTMDQVVEAGPLHFTAIRLLILAGLVRVAVRGEAIAGRMNLLDRLMLVWALWALGSSLLYDDLVQVLINRLGFVFNACGIYVLFRVFCRTREDVERLFRTTALLLVPVAAAMLYESLTEHNIFAALTGGAVRPELRGGRVRAEGPFAHAILAGTIGAACLPFVASLWQQHRREALTGIVACVVIIFTSSSSGPIMSGLFAGAALVMWNWRHRMKLVRWMAVLGYIGLDLIMNAPAYYAIARIDLTGSSTSWHRARLIESAIEHLSEWWLAGTDYTRHWMPTGVDWSGNHTDITNYYLSMGVAGGLPLMAMFIALLATAFSFVGYSVRQNREAAPSSSFLIWALGASLFTHAASFVSVSYFDQSFVFFYLTLAVIGSVRSAAAPGTSPEAMPRLGIPQHPLGVKSASSRP